MDFDCDDFEKTLKVIVVGNGNVGKTSMTTRYAKGKYTGNYKKTIGVDFMEKSVELRDLGETVNLMIWDTAGQEEFDALTSRYYKGAGAVIYVFSTVDRDSFDDLPKWKRKVEEGCGRICQVLVQNKIDLSEDAAMSRAEIEDMADYMNIRLFRSCVQENVNVKEVFEHLCRQFLKHGGSGGSDDHLNAVTDINSHSELASNGDERGGHHHHHSHSGSKDSERRARHEISDLSDHDSEGSSPQRPHESSRSSRADPPNSKQFVPTSSSSKAAGNAKGRENRRASDDDERRSDDEEGDQRRDRRQQQRHRQKDGREQEEEDRRPSRRDDQSRDGTRHSGDRSSKARDASSKGSSSTKSKYSVAREEERASSSKKKGDAVPQDQSSCSDEDEADEDNAAADPRDKSKAKADEVVMGDEAEEEDDDRAAEDSHPSTNSSSTFKLQPSKRRTNGKKRQSVPECMLS
ncbi:hypothetical protein Gpo141_00011511 [Globisporangium polare]